MRLTSPANLTMVAVMVVASTALAESHPPKFNNQIAALRLRTGEVIWTFKPKKLSDAHFEVYPEGLVVYPHYGGDRRSNGIFLDAMRGKPVKPFEVNDQHRLALSATFSPPPKIVLENGWNLVGFSAGNTKTLRFSGPKSSRPAAAGDGAKQKAAAGPLQDPKSRARTAAGGDIWSIRTGGYPHALTSWKNIVIYAFSYLSNEAVIYAYGAGDDKPQWKVDLNAIVTDRAQRLTRMHLQVIGNTLYVEANEHIFAFHPQNGKLIWHRDLCADLDLQFRPDLFGGGLNLAVFAESKDVLIISFERRVIAYDLQRGRYLWHFEPDTFPHCPFPAIHDGKVYLSCGENHRLHQLGK